MRYFFGKSVGDLGNVGKSVFVNAVAAVHSYHKAAVGFGLLVESGDAFVGAHRLRLHVAPQNGDVSEVFF